MNHPCHRVGTTVVGVSYRHRQHSVALTIAIVAVVITLIVLVMGAGADPVGRWIAVAMGFLLLVLGAVFRRLDVEIGDRAVTVSFGWGWPSRTIELVDVVNADAVRNRWWHGFGIRKVRNGWMFNVDGLDAVELVLRSGKVFRIGTDEPDELLSALRTAGARVG